jgi:tripartite ATP-independent transporter DctM subunit
MNRLNKAIQAMDKVAVFSSWCNSVGIAIVFLTVCLTFVDVILRYIFNRPIIGVYELVSMLMVAVAYLGIAHTQDEKAHVAADLVTARLAPKSRLIVETTAIILSIGLFIILIWRSAVQTSWFLETGNQASRFIPLPTAPFAGVIVLGCTLLCLILIRDLLKNSAEALKLQFRGYQWLIMFGVPIVVTVLAALWMLPGLWQMSKGIVAILGATFFVVFLFTGMPASFSLILTGLIFLGHIVGTGSMFNIVSADIFRSTATYTWAVLAFFVLMGYMCLTSRLGEDLYHMAYKWLGRISGGMAVATVAACAAFGAIVGEALSPTITFGAVALPEMRKYKYSDVLSCGSIVGGATLGPIIPPSLSFIIYGVLTGESIGRLFVGGIIPGLLFAVIMVLVIYFWCRFKPNAGPRGEPSTWGEKIKSTRSGLPIFILFVLVIGGIYAGIFTPTEGGAIGAVLAFVIGLVMRRWSWQKINTAFLETGKVVAMVFLMIFGATLFTRFGEYCNLTILITDFLTGLNVSPNILVLFILVVFFILGFPVDILPLVLIGVPLVYPITTAMGVDPIWFAVMLCITIGVGEITPPVGVVLYAMKHVAKVPINIVFWGALPFVLATMFGIALLFFFPSLVTWLPNLLYN